jgi:hypothetical protein
MRARVLMVAAACVGAATTALAQAHGESPKAKPDAVQSVLVAALDALGAVRGPQRVLTAINTIQYRAQGSVREDGVTRRVDRYVAGLSYAVPAMREDFAFVSGRRVIVVNNATAWNETAPGVGDQPSNDVAARTARLWASPFGVVRAAIEAEPRDVAVSKQGPATVLTVKRGALTLTARLNPRNLPESVRVTGAGPAREFIYQDYKGDWDGYDVFFPAHIIEKAGGTTVRDLTITEFRNNPYVVFPIPRALRAAGK